MSGLTQNDLFAVLFYFWQHVNLWGSRTHMTPAGKQTEKKKHKEKTKQHKGNR
jgi:hypothetical protein